MQEDSFDPSMENAFPLNPVPFSHQRRKPRYTLIVSYLLSQVPIDVKEGERSFDDALRSFL